MRRQFDVDVVEEARKIRSDFCRTEEIRYVSVWSK